MRRSRKKDPERRQRARNGWANWYVNRGRLRLALNGMSLSEIKREMRLVSWRRVL